MSESKELTALREAYRAWFDMPAVDNDGNVSRHEDYNMKLNIIVAVRDYLAAIDRDGE